MRKTGTIAAALLFAGAAFADPVMPGDVSFDDYGSVAVSLSGVAGDPAAGAEIMVSRGKGNGWHAMP